MKIETRIYIDSRGWKYQVMPGIGSGTYKARYQKPGNGRWSCCANLPWRSTLGEAEADLKALAARKGWDCCLSVSKEAMLHIVQNRKPLGLFLAWDFGGGLQVCRACDNRTGNAWTAEFPSRDEAFAWLTHEAKEAGA